MEQTSRFLLVVCALAPLFSQAQPGIPDRWGQPYTNNVALTENLGQVRGTDGQPVPQVQYYTRGGQLRAYVQKHALVSLVLAALDTDATTLDTLRRLDFQPTGEVAAYPDATAYVVKDYIQNFYLPWCGPNGVTDVHSYSGIKYENMWPNIDMLIYGTPSGEQISFVVRPGGHPFNLQLLFSGQDWLGLDVYGNLKMILSGKEIRLPQAVAYQVNTDNTVVPMSWTANYTADNGSGVVGFQFSSYDASKVLVFQIGHGPLGGPITTPGVCWRTYFGGDGTDQITASTAGVFGDHFVTGYTNSSFTLFPHDGGQVIFQGTPSVYASRFDANDKVWWSDYFGGSGASQRSTAMVVNHATTPMLYVVGQTSTTNFFSADPNLGNDYYDPNTSGGVNGFITRFNAQNGALLWSTYFGNNTVTVQDVTVDDADRLIVVGTTSGDLPAHQVPLPPNAETWTYAGNTDGFVALFTSEEKVLWSAYIGGPTDESAITVRTSPTKIVVVGITTSNMHHLAGGSNAHNDTYSGGAEDVFIQEFDLNGDQQWGTCVGGNGQDLPGNHGLAIDQGTGDVYITGYTRSSDLQLVHPTDWYDDTFQGEHSNGFIAEFSGVDRSDRWITYVSGTNGDDVLNSIALGDHGQVYVAGYTTSSDFPTLPLTGIYSEQARRGSSDGVVMSSTGTHWRAWSTYFGGDNGNTGLDWITTMTVNDQYGKLYVAGNTTTNYVANTVFFPLTNPQTTAWFDPVYNPVFDGFIAGFCTAGVLTGIEGSEPNPVGATIRTSGPDQFAIDGLPRGTQTIRVFDASGRLVLEQVTLTDGTTAAIFTLPHCASGVYAVHVLGWLNAKVLVQR
ncbi:MAG: SBBP repeat-containing protein [Flavobacteriales bacterium]|nr:SBBP repeat-containing protein [Flavobacteriales bacterium]MCC6938507.1 SBBP repeat-containing protein [Flavobacteriales bacterium]